VTPREVVTIIIPTVAGREAKLERTVSAYLATTPPDVICHVQIMRGYSTCGMAWQLASDMAWADGRDQLDGRYLHYSADDLVPHDGWYLAAVRACKEGKAPCPVVERPDATIESAGAWEVVLPDGEPAGSTVIPFFPLALWPRVDPIPEIHYHSDDYVSAKLTRAGQNIRVTYGYRFTHYLDPHDPGRNVVRGDEIAAKREALGEML
jgi:hypothetical protein